MINKIILYTAIILLSATKLSAQEEWIVPEDKKAKLSSFEFTEEINKQGEEVYKANCVSCHGTPGQNNFVPLVPPPGDPASEKFQLDTDGELYHKIREGRGAMPSFKATLTPDQVWSLVGYIRSFHENYTQEVAKEIERGAYAGEVSIKLNYLAAKKLIEAQVIGTNDGQKENIEGAEISLATKRLFGDLTIDEPKVTNKNGIALFDLSEPIQGDKEGNVTLLAKLTDQEAFGVILEETTLSIGEPNTNGSLLESRAMWNKARKAPLWIMLSYLAMVFGAWGALLFIALQIRKIYMIGKESE